MLQNLNVRKVWSYSSTIEWSVDLPYRSPSSILTLPVAPTTILTKAEAVPVTQRTSLSSHSLTGEFATSHTPSGFGHSAA